ncbi:MAG TPA: MBL fold metallo-hydrolase [Humisphaera sp.]|jgi:glyoxylase-like metal-dependent hydrolase (beta-lactamase superfamily II)|nr:MBL fold metallo-hydrolase [Humisphaera sp.]
MTNPTPHSPSLPTRGRFLAGAVGLFASALTSRGADEPKPAARWKGAASSKIKRWDVITIGNLSRNRYWGEPDTKAMRAAICTTTLITGDDFHLLVDPSLADAEQMIKELDRRTGLKPKDITAAFVTHEHSDHWVGLPHFPEARWYAGPIVAAALNKTGKFAKPIEGASGKLFDAVDVLPTPGHTPGHTSLRFDCEGRSIITAGDAVATHDFFRDRRGYFNVIDDALSHKSMDRMAALADLIVPGHDNYFLVE